MMKRNLKNKDWINNTCWVCGFKKMQIYSLERNKSENSSYSFIWCRCPKCDSVDDIDADDDKLNMLLTIKPTINEIEEE